MYENRGLYRRAVNREDLVFFSVSHKETEVYIGALQDLSREALSCICGLREALDSYIATDERFLKSLVPIEARWNAPRIARDMCRAAALAGVGPMASVAGAFSQYIGRELLKKSPEIIVENGGDIFLATEKERTIAIYAGSSPLSMKLGVKIKPTGGMGVCTSSGTIGHSLSFGKADAALILSPDALIADAAATTLGNAVKSPKDIGSALEAAFAISGVSGALAIMGGSMGAIGEIELTEL